MSVPKYRANVRRLLVAAVLFSAGIGTLAATPAGAACAGPQLTVDPLSGPAGATVTLHGEFFGTDCIDTGPNPGLGAPAQDIALYFVQDDVPVEVATVDADTNYEFTVEVTVPSEATEGPAVFATDSSQGPPSGAEFTVTEAAAPAAPAAPIEAAPSFTG